MRDRENTERIARIETLAERIHAGQLDQQGIAYIEHLRAVADRVSTRAKAVALLHDSLEDQRWAQLLIADATTATEFRAIVTLTRRAGETYGQYIERIRLEPGLAGELAREVKRADLEHNLERLTPELERLRGRYEAARGKLDCA